MLGRVATQAARLLQGKHKASWVPFLDQGDHVVIVNAARVKLIEQFARAHGFFRRCSTLPAPGSVTAGTEALLHRSGSTDEHK